MKVFPQVLGGFGLEEVLTVDTSKTFYQIGGEDDVEIENETDEDMDDDEEDDDEDEDEE
jgi:hypothetical protein